MSTTTVLLCQIFLSTYEEWQMSVLRRVLVSLRMSLGQCCDVKLLLLSLAVSLLDMLLLVRLPRCSCAATGR